MIARVWTARAAHENAAAYREHFETSVVPSLRRLDGYVAGSLLLRVEGSETQIIVLTHWSSLDAVGAFAGDDIEAAVVADHAQRLLSSWDERVRHYTIVVNDRGRGEPTS
jgi:heme-degrading monooxygenase HmoA